MTAKRYTVDDSIKESQSQKRENRQFYVTFILMLVLTALSFVAVASEKIPSGFTIPFILLIAFILLVLQVVIFMHLNDKNTEFPTLFFFSGFFIAIITIATLMLLIWW